MIVGHVSTEGLPLRRDAALQKETDSTFHFASLDMEIFISQYLVFNNLFPLFFVTLMSRRHEFDTMGQLFCQASN